MVNSSSQEKNEKNKHNPVVNSVKLGLPSTKEVEFLVDQKNLKKSKTSTLKLHFRIAATIQ